MSDASRQLRREAVDRLDPLWIALKAGIGAGTDADVSRFLPANAVIAFTEAQFRIGGPKPLPSGAPQMLAQEYANRAAPWRDRAAPHTPDDPQLLAEVEAVTRRLGILRAKGYRPQLDRRPNTVADAVADVVNSQRPDLPTLDVPAWVWVAGLFALWLWSRKSG